MSRTLSGKNLDPQRFFCFAPARSLKPSARLPDPTGASVSLRETHAPGRVAVFVWLVAPILFCTESGQNFNGEGFFFEPRSGRGVQDSIFEPCQNPRVLAGFENRVLYSTPGSWFEKKPFTVEILPRFCAKQYRRHEPNKNCHSPRGMRFPEGNACARRIWQAG